MFLIQEWYRRRISIADHRVLWAQCVHHCSQRGWEGKRPQLQPLAPSSPSFSHVLHLLSFLYFFHRHREKLVRHRGQHYARHLLVLHRRTSTKVGLNRPKGQPEEFAPVVLIKGECFPSSLLIPVTFNARLWPSDPQNNPFLSFERMQSALLKCFPR